METTKTSEAAPKREIVESLADASNHDLADWRQLWLSDQPFPIRSHRGLIGSVIVALKRVFRGIVKAPQADLWERQRLYNLSLQHHLEAQGGQLHQVARDLQQIQKELSRDLKSAQNAAAEDLHQVKTTIETDVETLRDSTTGYLQSHDVRVTELEEYQREGVGDYVRYADAIFSRMDQKLDRYRRESQRLWGELRAVTASADSEQASPVARAVDEQDYLHFEGQFRGTESEIRSRIAVYEPHLNGKGDVLDLGCGRGEALQEFQARGIPARGVDSSAGMVEACRAKGLEAAEGDLFETLENLPAGELGGIVSFHVIEHLPPTSVDRAVRMAWKALKPGGVLILETPSPLSIVVSARNFWIDPTHRRPVHPAQLEQSFRIAGFDPVERVDLQPFSPEERLTELDLSDLSSDLRPFGEQLNHLRDQLDEILYGFQDYGIIGVKPKR